MNQATTPEILGCEPLIIGHKSRAEITELVAHPLDHFPNKIWFALLAVSLSAFAIGLGCIAWLIYKGIGVWGNNNPVGWGFDIVNFVFWIGIGHAGTLISAILFLFRQKWRCAINRAAEAMTIFAVMCAGIFPAIHVGRVWFAWYLFPLPTQQNLWVNFRSPLLWDVFAVSTYLTVSALFWYMGLVPDLATLRDRTKNPVKKTIYSILSLGWRGASRQWKHYESAYMIFAGLSTPLVLSVHSIVSFDFATSVMPGWHTTIFPPYFVVGAIFGGFAMVLLLLSVTRKVFHFENIITISHLDAMNKIILFCSLVIGLAYATEFFIAWYSSNSFEYYTFVNRMLGPYGWCYWIMVLCNVMAPQIMWFRKYRRNILVMIIVSFLVTIGMWFERFVIIATSLSRDYLPSSWDMYYPTRFDFGVLLGSFGLFFTLYLIFVRVLPALSVSELKGILKSSNPKGEVDDVQA
ncbi:MAG: polysulfide reductase NrfD [Deltaproteobacteria bacterium]|nr:polysulfide reductase NrfD [Deltaproteobacteria bacterium]